MKTYLSPTIETATNSAKMHVDGNGRHVHLIDSTYGQNAKNINMSSIYSRLIQEAGRWTINYASDLLYDIKAIANYIKNPTDEVAYFPIGIRRNGVDGYNFIISRLINTRSGLYPYVYPEQIYNALLSVKVINEPGKLTVELWDIYHDLNKIHESDEPKNKEKEEKTGNE